MDKLLNEARHKLKQRLAKDRIRKQDIVVPFATIRKAMEVAADVKFQQRKILLREREQQNQAVGDESDSESGYDYDSISDCMRFQKCVKKRKEHEQEPYRLPTPEPTGTWLKRQEAKRMKEREREEKRRKEREEEGEYSSNSDYCVRQRLKKKRTGYGNTIETKTRTSRR